MATVVDYLAYGFVRLLGILPMSVLYALGGFVGRIMWWTNSSSAKVSRTNVDMCFPHLSKEERAQIARESVYEMSRIMLESLAAWCKPFDKTFGHRFTKFSGKEVLEKALEQDRPIVLLSSHFGSYEVLYLYIHKLFDNAAIMFRPPKMKKLGDFVLKARGKNGGLMMPSTREGIEAYCNVLTKPEGIVAIAADLVPSWERGVFANFMGAPALTANFPTDLVRNNNATVVCIHMVRMEDNNFHIHFEKVSQDIYSEDKKIAAQAMNDAIGKRIAANPEQYAWSYKRFKRMPDHSKPYD